MAKYDVDKLKPGDRVRALNFPAIIVQVHEPQWVDYKTGAFCRELSGADVRMFGDTMNTYVKAEDIELISKSAKKCVRFGCGNSITGNSHNIGWGEDYCSSTCAFHDR
ncbi:MAG: hypothetical protein WCT77_13245 [Bacteroidota bacterium]